MKHKAIALAALLVCVLVAVQAQRRTEQRPLPGENSERKMPELVLRAQYVMVVAQREAEMGSRPDAEDLRVVADTEAAIRKWGRYQLVFQKEAADLILSVRRSSTMAQIGGGPGSRDTAPQGDSLGVFNARIGGTGSSPLWRKGQKDGLARPNMPLLKMFREEVEAAAIKNP